MRLGVFFLVSILLATLCFLDLVDYFLSQVTECCCMQHYAQSCLTLATHGLLPTNLPPWTILCPQNFLRKNTRMHCHLLYHGIFLTQASNPCLLRLLHCKWILYRRATWEALMWWKFPAIISSNNFSGPFSLSSLSRTPTMRMLVHFMLSQMSLMPSSFFFFFCFFFLYSILGQ